MKTDLQIKADMDAELAWDPAVNGSQVRVAVKNGVVTFTGDVGSYLQKHAVERAACRIGGVRGVASELEVRLPPDQRRSDAEIAEAALQALRWHSAVPEDQVAVEVKDGHLTLAGEVASAYQSASAEQCVHPLIGVKRVTNNLRLKPRASVADLKHEIAAALARRAQREAEHIAIDVDGSVVTLTGTVGSLAAHEAAIGTALAARGVTRVVDRLVVEG